MSTKILWNTLVFLWSFNNIINLWKKLDLLFNWLVNFREKLLLSALREGTLNCKLHWYPRFHSHIILFVGSKAYCTFIRLLLVGLNCLCPNFPTNIFHLQKELYCLSLMGMYINLLSIVLSLKNPAHYQRAKPYVIFKILAAFSL